MMQSLKQVPFDNQVGKPGLTDSGNIDEVLLKVASCLSRFGSRDDVKSKRPIRASTRRPIRAIFASTQFETQPDKGGEAILFFSYHYQSKNLKEKNLPVRSVFST